MTGALKEFPYQVVLSTVRGHMREQIPQGKSKLVVSPARQTSEIQNN